MSTYCKAILAYLDVLGFRALIRQSETDLTKVDEIIQLLNVTRRKGMYGYSIHNEVQVATQHFSDLMVRITPLNGTVSLIERLNVELMALARIQVELAARRILIRGGVCLKDVFNDGGLLFGPALVRSYELAEESAVYPRIVIDTALMNHAKAETAEIWPKVYKRGEDGQYFVDYLSSAITDPYTIGAIFENSDDLLFKHKATIENALADAGDETIRRKFIWMGLYHNSTLDRLAPDKLELRISDQTLAQ